jgi:hydroxymethylglutaryl-CoA reductase (NADPH)
MFEVEKGDIELSSRKDASRVYFHANREPKVLLNFRSHIYHGVLASYWGSGVEIKVIENLTGIAETDLVGLYLGRFDRAFLLEGMAVIGIRTMEHRRQRITLAMGDPRSCAKLKEIIHHLKESKDRVETPGAAKTRRIPGSSPKNHYGAKAIRERIEWTEAVSSAQIDELAKATLDPPKLAGNIENYVGAVQIPIGIAGPVHVRGTYTDDFIPVPIATTEGALISSITRGAAACNLGGGIEAHVHSQRMIRAPAFICEDMQGALNLERWIQRNKKEIISKAESISSIARVQGIETHVFNTMLHVVFSYSTGDASGQNMTTSCTWYAANWIQEQVRDNAAFRYRRFLIELNMSGDKKLSNQNLSGNRGVRVTATCFIPDNVMRRVLQVSAAEFHEVYQMAEVGALSAGIASPNINFANVIGGVFAATGQDIACVHESAGGFLKITPERNGLRFIAHLPGLVIGTIGGGTGLPTQKECLEIMGCYGKGKLFRLAEIIAATCLALDISTGTAIISHQFVKAHERLGRNRPKRFLSPGEIDSKFFSSLLREEQALVRQSQEIALEQNSGILSELKWNEEKKALGIRRYRLDMTIAQRPVRRNVILKLKKSDNDLIDTGLQMSKLSGNDSLAGLFASQSSVFNIENSHVREIRIYQHGLPELLKFCPRYFGSRIEEERELFALLLEDLSGHAHLDTVNQPELWQMDDIQAVLRDMARLHSVYFQANTEETTKTLLVHAFDMQSILDSQALLQELANHNADNYPWMKQTVLFERVREFLDQPLAYGGIADRYPKTLVHNDFNPRNLGMRIDGGAEKSLVIYDWELACFANPQRDLIEFLSFVFTDDTPMERFVEYVEGYRKQLETACSVALEPEEFWRVLQINALVFAATRLNLYYLGQGILKLKFIERVYKNLDRLLTECFEDGAWRRSLRGQPVSRPDHRCAGQGDCRC